MLMEASSNPGTYYPFCSCPAPSIITETPQDGGKKVQRTHADAQGWFHGPVVSAVTQGPTLALMLSCQCLEIINSFFITQ